MTCKYGKGDEELGEVKLNERGDWVAKFPAPGDEMEGCRRAADSTFRYT